MREDVSRSSARRGSRPPRRIERRPVTAIAWSAIRMAPLAAGIVAAGLATASLFALPAGAHRSSHHARTPIYLDTRYTFAERAADLVARLTPTQRASQIVSSQAPAITTAANPLLTETFGGQTALAAPASAGDTNIKVESTGGLAVGAKLTIDPNGTPETVTVTAVGSGPSGFFTPTLVAAANPGDTNVKVNFTFGMTAGDVMRIDTGANVEFATIQSVGTAGAGGTGVTFTAPLTLAHAVGAPAVDLGTGVTFTPALTSAHEFGAPVRLFVGIPAYGWWNEALHGINAESLNPSGQRGNADEHDLVPDRPVARRELGSRSDVRGGEGGVRRGARDRAAPTSSTSTSTRRRSTSGVTRAGAATTSPTARIRCSRRRSPASSSTAWRARTPTAGSCRRANGFYKATTTLKHYALNNTEGTSNGDPNGRLNGSSNTDDRSIREYYTMPFRKIVQSSQNGAIMSSYNEINGVPVGGQRVPERHADARDVRPRRATSPATATRSTRSTPAITGSRRASAHIATVVEQFAFTLGSGEDAECNAGYNGSGSYRGPTSPSTTQGGLMNAIGMHIPTADRASPRSTTSTCRRRACSRTG